MVATLKVHKWHASNVCIRLVQGIHEPYQTLPSASMDMRPLTSPESIAEVPDWQSLKRANHLSSDFLLFSFFSISQPSMITAEAITMIQMRKTSINHRVLYSLLIVILALELFFSDSQALKCQYSVLYTPPAGSSTEHMFSYFERGRRQQPRLGSITDWGCVCFEEKY